MLKPTLRLSALLPLGLTVLLTTAACTRTPDTAAVNGTAPTAEAVNPADPIEDTASLIALSGEGLQLVGDQTGSTATLEFGSEMDLVEAAVTNILGEPLETGENTECGSGPQIITQWPSGLALHAAEGEFIGWSVSPDPEATLTTIAGIGIDSTRSELESAYTVEVMESSLGTEFSTGDLFGLLNSAEPDATVNYLWAGTTCNFR